MRLFLIFWQGFLHCIHDDDVTTTYITTFSLLTCLTCLLLSPINRYLGRMVPFGIAAILNAVVMATLLLWSPTASDSHVFLIMAALWGVANGIWTTQLQGNIYFSCFLFYIRIFLFFQHSTASSSKTRSLHSATFPSGSWHWQSHFISCHSTLV